MKVGSWITSSFQLQTHRPFPCRCFGEMCPGSVCAVQLMVLWVSRDAQSDHPLMATTSAIMETPMEPPAGGSRRGAHISQQGRGIMLISGSFASGSDSSWTFSLWIIVCCRYSRRLRSESPFSVSKHWRHPLPQHLLLSPSATSLTFNVTILLEGITAVLGREDKSSRELSRREAPKKMVERLACACARVCAFLILLRETSQTTPLQPPSLNNLFLSHSFTSLLLSYNCCSTCWVPPCVDFCTIAASKATPTILPVFETCWPGALGESFPSFLLLFMQWLPPPHVSGLPT